MLPEPRRNRVHDIVGVAVEQDDYYNCQCAQLRRENVGQATAVSLCMVIYVHRLETPSLGKDTAHPMT
jgi:hypothetical protein